MFSTLPLCHGYPRPPVLTRRNHRPRESRLPKHVQIWWGFRSNVQAAHHRSASTRLTPTWQPRCTCQRAAVHKNNKPVKPARLRASLLQLARARSDRQLTLTSDWSCTGRPWRFRRSTASSWHRSKRRSDQLPSRRPRPGCLGSSGWIWDETPNLTFKPNKVLRLRSVPKVSGRDTETDF